MKNMRRNYLDFAFLVAWITISLMLAWLAFSRGGVDFGVYYAAARITLQNGNPYDYNQLATEIVKFTGEANNPYYYAPWFTWAMLPLSLLPYQSARVFWAIINVSLWFFGLINLGKIINWPETGWRRWAMYIFATILFAWTTWGFEQVGVLIFFLLIMFLLETKKDHWFAAGFWLALLLFKPNITALPVVAIIIWFVLKKNWKPAIVAGIATTVMFTTSLAILPGWYRALLQPDKLTGLSYKFSESGALGMVRYNTTLMDWLTAYNITGTLATLIYLTVAALALAILGWTITRSQSLIHVAAMALLMNFAITPYALSYDYPALVLTLFHANHVSYQKSLLTFGQMALNGFVLFSLFIGTTISFRYWITIAIALVMIFRYIAERVDTNSAHDNPTENH